MITEGVIAAIGIVIGTSLTKVFDFVLLWYQKQQSKELTEQQELLKEYKEIVASLQKQAEQTKLDYEKMQSQYLIERVENATLKVENVTMKAHIAELEKQPSPNNGGK